MKKLSFITKNLKSLDFAKSYNNYKSVKQEGKTSKISYIPPRFTFTITSKCNLRCPTCQYMLQDPQLFENSGFMNIDDYKNILNKYNRYITNLTLTGGEATLHPELEKIIDFLSRFKYIRRKNGTGDAMFMSTTGAWRVKSRL